MDKPVLNLEDPEIKKAFEMGKELATKNEDGELKEIMAKIEKYEKFATMFAPVISKFISGFTQNLPAKQAAQLPQMQPPEGWLEMTPLQKLNRKHRYEDWYKAGQRYDEEMSNGGATPSIQVNQQPQTPSNLNQLARKYAEPLPINDRPPTREQTPAPAAVEEPKPAPAEEPKQNSEAMEIQKMLAQDNDKYVQMAVDKINSMKKKDFRNSLVYRKDIIKDYKPMIAFIPIHLKSMLLQAKPEDILNLLNEKCPSHYKYIVKNKLVDEVKTAYLEIQELLKE